MTQISNSNPQVIIAGGGLAGLCSSILLAQSGFHTTVIEKKAYPFHRVCGEYVSNEVVPFLKRINCYPEHLNVPVIRKFQLSDTVGNISEHQLELGGFGISRYRFDQLLYERAVSSGVHFHLNTSIEKIERKDERHILTLSKGEVLETGILISAHGKRSKIDRNLNRTFWNREAPYFGVKYHLKTDFPNDLIQLHNFEGGYCGVSQVEGATVNACYLASTEILKRHGSIAEMEERVVFKNPYLRKIFRESEMVFEKPITINEVSFSKKAPVENGIFMCGDAAGLITPLCGNGMAMAIHSAKICSEVIISNVVAGKFNRSKAEKEYRSLWNSLFRNRLWRGRVIQRLFGNQKMSSIAVSILKNSGVLGKLIIGGTHGRPF